MALQELMHSDNACEYRIDAKARTICCQKLHASCWRDIFVHQAMRYWEHLARRKEPEEVTSVAHRHLTNILYDGVVAIRSSRSAFNLVAFVIVAHGF